MNDHIEAREGYILSDGETYGTWIRLAEGVDASKFHEITIEEYNRKLEAEAGAVERKDKEAEK